MPVSMDPQQPLGAPAMPGTTPAPMPPVPTQIPPQQTPSPVPAPVQLPQQPVPPVPVAPAPAAMQPPSVMPQVPQAPMPTPVQPTMPPQPQIQPPVQPSAMVPPQLVQPIAPPVSAAFKPPSVEEVMARGAAPAAPVTGANYQPEPTAAPAPVASPQPQISVPPIPPVVPMQTQAAQANVQYRQPTVEEVMARTQQTAPSPISSTAPYQPPSVDEVLARGQAEAGASQQYVVHEQGQTKKPPLLFRLLGHTSDANSRWNTAFRFVKLVAKSFGIFALIIIVGRFFIFSPGAVNGPSMERTFLDEDTFYVNRFVYLISAPKRYDVVQMINPQEEKLIIKRVIGLPGETVVIRRGKVFVIPVGQKEQVEVPEPYLREGITTTVPLQQGAAAFTLEADEYFVIGDNRPKSIDSRNYGPVGREEIIGRVVLKPEQKIQVTFPASVDET